MGYDYASIKTRETTQLRQEHVALFQKLLQQERKLLENTVAARKKLLSDCRILHDRLKEYNLNLLMDGNGNFIEDSTTVSDALRLLSISDDQIEEVLLHLCFISI